MILQLHYTSTLSLLPRKNSDTEPLIVGLICIFLRILFSVSDGFSVTSVSGYKQQGHNPVEEFTASFMSIHPDQCPFLTVILWSFSALLFWSMYAGCLRQNYTESIQSRTTDLFPLRLLLQAHHVPKHHKSPITVEQSYCSAFAWGIPGFVILSSE